MVALSWIAWVLTKQKVKVLLWLDDPPISATEPLISEGPPVLFLPRVVLNMNMSSEHWWNVTDVGQRKDLETKHVAVQFFPL